MNLKEAFRYQNRLQRLMDEAVNILSREGNVTRVENTALLHKVNPEVQDETTVEPFDSEYGNCATEVAVFLMYLLEERQKLSQAIRAAKQAMSMDFDGEVSLNAKRPSDSSAGITAELRDCARIFLSALEQRLPQ